MKKSLSMKVNQVLQTETLNQIRGRGQGGKECLPPPKTNFVNSSDYSPFPTKIKLRHPCS